MPKLYITAPTAAVFDKIAQALGDQCDHHEETMRQAWGDETVDWMQEQEKTDEYKHWDKKRMKQEEAEEKKAKKRKKK